MVVGADGDRRPVRGLNEDGVGGEDGEGGDVLGETAGERHQPEVAGVEDGVDVGSRCRQDCQVLAVRRPGVAPDLTRSVGQAASLARFGVDDPESGWLRVPVDYDGIVARLLAGFLFQRRRVLTQHRDRPPVGRPGRHRQLTLEVAERPCFAAVGGDDVKAERVVAALVAVGAKDDPAPIGRPAGVGIMGGGGGKQASGGAVARQPERLLLVLPFLAPRRDGEDHRAAVRRDVGILGHQPVGQLLRRQRRG